MICDGKRFEYHFIISLWDCKKNSMIDVQKIFQFIRKNYLKDMFEDDIYLFDSAHAVIRDNLILQISGKWLRYDKVEYMAIKISDKFHNDIILTMTDDDGCSKANQIFYKPKVKSKLIEE